MSNSQPEQQPNRGRGGGNESRRSHPPRNNKGWMQKSQQNRGQNRRGRGGRGSQQGSPNSSLPQDQGRNPGPSSRGHHSPQEKSWSPVRRNRSPSYGGPQEGPSPPQEVQHHEDRRGYQKPRSPRGAQNHQKSNSPQTPPRNFHRPQEDTGYHRRSETPPPRNRGNQRPWTPPSQDHQDHRFRGSGSPSRSHQGRFPDRRSQTPPPRDQGYYQDRNRSPDNWEPNSRSQYHDDYQDRQGQRSDSPYYQYNSPGRSRTPPGDREQQRRRGSYDQGGRQDYQDSRPQSRDQDRHGRRGSYDQGGRAQSRERQQRFRSRSRSPPPKMRPAMQFRDTHTPPRGHYQQPRNGSPNSWDSRSPSPPRNRRQGSPPRRANSWDTVSRSPSPRRQGSSRYQDPREGNDYQRSQSPSRGSQRSPPRDHQDQRGGRNWSPDRPNSRNKDRGNYDSEDDYQQRQRQRSNSPYYQSPRRSRTPPRDLDQPRRQGSSSPYDQGQSRPQIQFRDSSPSPREVQNRRSRDGTPNSWESRQGSSSRPSEFDDPSGNRGPDRKYHFPNPKPSWLKWLEEQDAIDDSEDVLREMIGAIGEIREELEQNALQNAQRRLIPVAELRLGPGGRVVRREQQREKTAEEMRIEMEMKSTEPWSVRPTTHDPTSHWHRYSNPPCSPHNFSQLTRKIVAKDSDNKKLKNTCIYCNGRHRHDECPVIEDVDERRKHLVERGHCTRCLRKHRRGATCKNPDDIKCGYCDDMDPAGDLHHHSLCSNAHIPVETEMEW